MPHHRTNSIRLSPSPSQRRLPARFAHFMRSEDGTVMAEFLILLPLLLWCFMALFVYWDAFRTINEGQKASYAVADLLTRQANVSRNFVGGMDDLIAWLLATPVSRVSVRVTSIQWDEGNNRFLLLMSESPGNKMPALTQAHINTPGFKSRIPAMADADTVIVVETDITYRPPFLVDDGTYTNQNNAERVYLLSLNIPAQSFTNFIVTRPRNFRLCLIESPCSNAL